MTAEQHPVDAILERHGHKVVRLPVDEKAEDDAPTGGGWELVDLTEFVDGTYVAPEPEVGNREDGVRLFYKGRTNMVWGPSEGGKSWLALAAAVDEITSRRHVLYVDYEDHPPGIVGRLKALGADGKAILGYFHYVNPEQRFGNKWKERLRPIVEECSLVIIDATTEALATEGLRSKEDVEIAEFFHRVPKWFAKLGPAVILIDHANKDAESRGSGSTGSQHKRSITDGAQYLVEPVVQFAPGRNDGKSRVFCSKDRSGFIRGHSLPTERQGLWWFADFTLRQHEDSGCLWPRLWPPSEQEDGDDGDLLTPAAPKLMRAICDLLAQFPDGLTGNKIRAGVTGRQQSINLATTVLVRDGFVRIEHRGQAEIHRLVRPYPEAVA